VSAASAVTLIQCSTNFRYGGPIRLYNSKWRPMLIFDDPTSNLCFFQLPVIWKCYVNVMNRIMAKAMLS